MILDIDFNYANENEIKSLRIKKVVIDMKEIKLNIHGHFINEMLYFIESAIDLYPERIIAPFFESRVFMNYQKLVDILQLNMEHKVK